MKYKSTVIILVIALMIIIAFAVKRRISEKSLGSQTPDKNLIEFTTQLSKAESAMRSVLQITSEKLAEQSKPNPIHKLNGNYSLDKIGVFSNHSKTLMTNTYVGKGVAVSSNVKDFIARTDHLESLWKESKEKGGEKFPWLYAYHLSSNTLRMYPWVDFSKTFGPSVEWALVRYFRSMDILSPYIGKSFCTRLYDDIGGSGISFSCCRPIVFQDKFDTAILSCADYSIRDELENFRKSLTDNPNKCVQKIVIRSHAPAIEYLRDITFDVYTGIIQKGNNLLETIPSAELDRIASYQLLNIEVFVQSRCLGKAN